MSSQISLEWLGPERRVVVFTINRPQRGNSYTTAMLDDLARLIDDVSSSDTVAAAVLVGSGSVFCGGADIAELNARNERRAVTLASREVFDRWANMPWPTIAAVNGPAVGGGFELALACDIRCCAPRAFFSFPEIEHHLVPAAGGIRRLVSEIGAARAKEVLLFGKALDAATAYAWGLVAQVNERPLTWAIDCARALAERDDMCVAACKLLIADQIEASRGRGGEAIASALLYGRRNHWRDRHDER